MEPITGGPSGVKGLKHACWASTVPFASSLDSEAAAACRHTRLSIAGHCAWYAAHAGRSKQARSDLGRACQPPMCSKLVAWRGVAWHVPACTVRCM